MELLGLDNIPWEQRHDAGIIAEYNAIKNDPERLKNARRALEISSKVTSAALKDTPVPPSRRRSNPATIQRLNPVR